MEKCICKTVRTDRIGEIQVPDFKNRRWRTVQRFALDCPVHGIKVLSGKDHRPAQEKAVMTKEERVAHNKAARKARRARKQGGPNARHSDVPSPDVPGVPELPEEST